LSALLARLWHHLGQQRRRQFVLLLGLMLVSVVAEAVSLGAVLPFIGVLSAPEAVFANHFVHRAALALGITTAGGLLFPLTIAFALAALLAGAIRMLLLWSGTRLTFASGAELSTEIYRRTLYQPYQVHVGRNSSEVISGIAQKVGGTLLGVLLPGVMLVSSLLLVITIVLALVAIDPFVASIAMLGFGVGYGLITWFTRRRLRRNSQQIAVEQTRVVKTLQEGLGGIRDVLLDGTQSVYCAAYRSADLPLRQAIGDNVFISQSPRFVMEALGMVMIAALAYGLSGQRGGVAQALPILAALAMGAQRLLPAMQQAYSSWANIVGSQASLADTIALLEQPLTVEAGRAVVTPLAWRDSVQFEGVRFRYSGAGPWVLDGLSLTIPKGARVGLVGGTGSGKSTTMDLLMGLLVPTEGLIRVDGRPVDEACVQAWQRTIAHVPQNIYLIDGTFTENIAFGVPTEAVDHQKVGQAARQAQISDFIESQPAGYASSVGERGARLSGGQRQRIGIARALYKDASLLLLDEATSALDNLTEQSVMEAIAELHHGLTIILVAHRLSTVRSCDFIVELRCGRVEAQGGYDDLMGRSQTFRNLAHASARH
jgi:ABC-type multidrug transport system fused ATPase/permease subunit